jgi:hypothetical protein
MKFEPLPDRLRGIDYNVREFSGLLAFVKELDTRSKSQKIRFLLASKKAVEWSKIINGPTIDLRDFERRGLTLSQAIYAAQELSDLTLNWPNTFTIWLTNCDKIRHLTWGSYKDTAIWARERVDVGEVDAILTEVRYFKEILRKNFDDKKINKV